ncbi:MAG: ribonuclease HI [Zetaproteobacteria bacterium CG_4_9_14_3_um_filter_49_83]|nr:MAG: ribonuclease HI [Zetaproteobacteria bacterium CG1_02_49_23]PIQ34695.1 MAG: ribonuclease HI [Zetaproteobacteria bacterium CG17_big_fil_post_rev_8_21_14_2_50_50_13]PIV30005.1 MAG: ribonuclease HI [Zetaproteobacteria bacterium CG02_land_8_20_14_3_00_50_9]PIY54990.1 MAG: ribonuclease HI [Zetaproteobacteria bacterium CG_4_10_14_0_8_um_filter_49_80]PJA34278.1 MAG: ribonuclease HI [Zetaproteobacteria bacterium CG_4_9_14_3_um_filter_49_83]
MSQHIEAFTDGACSGNPGPGGWGVWLRYGKHEKELCGGEPNTTNQRMELQAAIEALKALKKPCAITIFSDSKYVVDGITSWIHGWKKNGWKNTAKKPVANAELWQQLDTLNAIHDVKWQWIKGHAGHEGNERADALARQGIPT